MPRAVLFDLGNTLAAYYRRDEFEPLLRRAISDIHEHLEAAGQRRVALEIALTRRERGEPLELAVG